MTDLQRAREIFGGDCFATKAAGAVIAEVGPGYAKCEMVIQPVHCNALGNPMGGAIFTLADFAFAVAANLDQPPTVSQNTQVQFLAVAKGKKLTAESEKIKGGRRSCVYQIHVTDELGTQVALVTIGGAILHGNGS